MVKFSNAFIEREVFKMLGVRDNSVTLGPGIGEDAAVIRINNSYMAVHTDPVTGSSNLLGWLAVHVAANDIATRGIRPRWFLVTLILPVDYGENDVVNIMRQINDALIEINASLVGGHTEKSDAVTRPIAVTTAIGIGSRFIRTGGLRTGDVIVMTKYAALEATAVLVSDFRGRLMNVLSEGEFKEATSLYRMVSVVNDALAAAEYATSMHDPTEGGVLQGLLEMAYSSGKLIIINEDNIPVLPVTRRVLNAFNLNPLTVLSSGSLLIGVGENDAAKLIGKLRDMGINASIIGKVTDGEPGVVVKGRSGEQFFRGDLTIPDGVIEMWLSGNTSEGSKA
ncbi:AIR synthase family protein [Caldivirga maquilingensis]|uniref:AIR synthase related protein domain protein n=1 Tax=Caldivirga maquilingensis (strain ATCC 700844 / DSM 13496 / JCM 10307 / IC-167) TaxID=397948 RepID=A8MDD6_CALMQ|nr:AIR synthase family protein [Caldivirga maquilingensis]ABW01792.1 AIR synthase related protein domain protein [Caldivirga maquilingensis IC-167]